MAISIKDFLKELNKDLEWEYASAIQYIQHSSALTHPEFVTISEEWSRHSDEEFDHAKKISSIISGLDGYPTMVVEERKISNDPSKMLEQDLETEEEMISRYRLRIAQAEELKEYEVKRALETILATEEEHKKKVSNAISK